VSQKFSDVANSNQVGEVHSRSVERKRPHFSAFTEDAGSFGVPRLLIEINARSVRLTVPPLLPASVRSNDLNRPIRQRTITTGASIFIVFIQGFRVFRPNRCHLTEPALDHFDAKENAILREHIEGRANLIRIDVQEARQVIGADDLRSSHRLQLGIDLLEDTREVRVLFS
jgi:hypothetical protein